MKEMGLSHAGFSYVKSRTLGKSRICTSLYMAVCRDTILLSTTKGYCSALGLEGKIPGKGSGLCQVMSGSPESFPCLVL